MISPRPQQPATTSTSTSTTPVPRFPIAPSVLQAARIGAELLMVAAFFFALTLQAGALSSYAWRLQPGWLLAAGVIALARGGSIVYPWWRIVRVWTGGGNRGLRFGAAARVYFHSGLARYVPGQWWYVPARVALAEGVGVRKAVTLAATAVETVMVIGSALSVAALGAATLSMLPSLSRWLVLAGGLALPAALTLSPALLSRITDRLLKLRGHAPLQTSLPPKETGRVLAGCYLNWLLYGSVAALLLAGVGGVGVNGFEQAPAVIGLFAASVLGGSLGLFVPQGLLVREGVLVTLLHVSLGVPVPAAIVAAALTRLFSLVAEGTWAAASSRF